VNRGVNTRAADQDPHDDGGSQIVARDTRGAALSVLIDRLLL